MVNTKNIFFDDISNIYKYRIPYHTGFIDLLKVKLKIDNNCRILDIGCGDGCLTDGLLDLVAEITGIDVSQQMINQAIKHPKRSFKVLDVNQSSSLNIIDSNYYDQYLLGHSIHWINSNSMARLIEHGLKTEGMVTCCGNNWDLKNPWNYNYSTLIEKYKSFDNSDVTGQHKMHIIGYKLKEKITFKYNISADINFLIYQSLSYARLREKILENTEKFYNELLLFMKPHMIDDRFTGVAVNWAYIYEKV